MLLIMSFSVSMPSFANSNSFSELIFAEDETKTSEDEEPDCE